MKSMKRIGMSVYLILMMDLSGAPCSAQEPATSRLWIDLYGSAVWSNHNPVESGTTIRVYDSDNTLCGAFVVKAEGKYGFMAVYGDDPLTPATDEGAEQGDELSFMIKGAQADILYGGSAVWSHLHVNLQVNLISTITGVEDETRLPGSFKLVQNYPNPFNPVTSIEYHLPNQCFVMLTIYNILGQKVNSLVHEKKEAGIYQIKWRGENDKGFPVSSGIYLYQIRAGNYRETKKFVLSR